MSTETTEAKAWMKVSQLRSDRDHSTRKATIQTEMDGARQHLQLAEEALEQKKESDRQTYAQLSAKVGERLEGGHPKFWVKCCGPLRFPMGSQLWL